MKTHSIAAGRVGIGAALKWLFVLPGCSGLFFGIATPAQNRESLAGEKAARALQESAQDEAGRYNIHYGPLGFQIGAGVRFGYTDNLFYSETNRVSDFLINPEVNLGAFLQVSELNTLKLSLRMGYEYYLKNTALNGNAPLVNPDTELDFNVFAGDFHIRLHERFSYQESLFNNTSASGQNLLFNFNNVGTFSRINNVAGVNVDWDLNKLILSVGYDHENFDSLTESFKYLNRVSELFTASASLLIGDHAKIGLESKGGLHDFKTETTLNDHWQARFGPFVDVNLMEKVNLRAGGGYDLARYDAAGAGSDYSTYYAYGRVSQETRLFTHSLSVGRENLLGGNANNLEDTYVRYSITSPAIQHWDVGANAAYHSDREYGAAFSEDFTYYVVGVKAGYQIHKNWRTEVGYEYVLKNSELALRNYDRNRVTFSLAFTF